MKTPRIEDFDPNAAERERQLGTPLDGMPAIQKPIAVQHPPALVRVKEQSSPVGVPVRVPKHPPALASEQQSKTQEFEKYSTFIRSTHKRKLKMIALEKDCKDYEVLDEALATYIAGYKK